MKKDSAKPKTEQVKKKKKDKTAKEFSNKKLYTFASKRGIMVMNAKGTGLTTLRLRPDAPEKDRSFAFLFVNGAVKRNLVSRRVKFTALTHSVAFPDI